MKLLFTSVGRRVELIQEFKDAADTLGLDLLMYGTDLVSDAPALFFCDRQYATCSISDKGYIPQLLDICAKEKIDALIPTIDTDLLILSQNKARFAEIGTKVIVSDEDKICICRDKRLTADFFSSCGLKTPAPVDDVTKYHGDYPCFIKPLDGSSSINAFKIASREDLVERSHTIKDYIVQPFIEGKEYTVDVFCDFEGKPLLITPRERLAVRSGEVLKTRIFQDPKMVEESKTIADAFKPCGAITIQLIRQKDTGEDYFIEINPRYGGGAPLSVKAGANSPMALLRLLKGEKLGYRPKQALDCAEFSRFDQSICVCGGKQTVKAVVFDLDDTLYPEKDYVASGFKAVEAKFPNVKAKELWMRWLNEKSVFDDKENKDELLTVYREHKPSIHLYTDVENLLVLLRKNGIKIGIITDGRPRGQRNKIEALKLEEYVDDIIVTDELGLEFRKPSDIPFRMMKQKLKVPFGNMEYVGDNVHKDFIAPRKLGMQYLWFDNPDGLYRSGSGDICTVKKMIETIITLCNINNCNETFLGGASSPNKN